MELSVPGDKSMTQRALLFAGLAEGPSRLSGLLAGEDPRALAEVLRGLGVDLPPIPDDGGGIEIEGVGLRGLRPPTGALDCRNSGTAARLLLGVLAGQELAAILTGDESLRSRPMARVTDPLTAMGARVRFTEAPGRLPVEVRGGSLRPIEHALPVASAQVKSALLLAGVVGGVGVRLTEPGPSRDHTERMLGAMGVPVERTPTGEGGFRVVLSAPPGSLRPLDFRVPGDFSSAAFLVVLGILGGAAGPLAIRGVGVNPTRAGLLPVLDRMGARVTVEAERDEGGEPVADLAVEPARPAELVGTEVGAREIPAMVDEVPALAVAAVRARGETRVTGAEELRVKESDRIALLVEGLRRLGVEADELSDGIVVRGTDAPLRGEVRTRGDHRIAMAFGVLGALPGSRVRVERPECVAVSYPGFWEVLGRIRAGRNR